MLIRAARPEDWAGIHPIFSAIVDAGRTYTYPEHLSSAQARALWMEPPPWRTLVAVDGETVLGSAKLGPNRPGRGSHVATASFMVDPQHEGRGVGRALATEVIASAREDGYRSMQFNAVVETNTAAIHLWEELGFAILATAPEAFDHPEHGLVGLHLMHARLPTGAADA